MVLIVSDVHGEFEALAQAARSGETLLVLGDLINLMDYRTGEGILAQVMGDDFGVRVSRHRAESDYPSMRELWKERSDGRREEISSQIGDLIADEYRRCREALTGGRGFVTFGNVDRPELLADSLPDGMQFVDGEVVEIEGTSFGFVGGGIATPVNAAGEVGDDEMTAKLESMGAVDVLCSHLPPAIPALRRDVVTGRLERASEPILAYLRAYRPRFHFFGDVHQPQATTWRVGPTLCRNVGYFRATKRPVDFDLSEVA